MNRGLASIIVVIQNSLNSYGDEVYARARVYVYKYIKYIRRKKKEGRKKMVEGGRTWSAMMVAFVRNV